MQSYKKISGTSAIALSLILFFNGFSITYSQVKNYGISFGLASTTILGDSPNSSLLVAREKKDHSFGGSFDGQQPGFGLRCVFDLDEKKRFAMPIGFDYEFYNAMERVPIDRYVTSFWKHTTQVITGIIGVKYFFVKFPFANVRAYAGLEARGAFIRNGRMYWEVHYRQYDTTYQGDYSTKGSAFRLGSAVQLGVDGDLLDPFYINFSLGLGILNLVGRNDARGELLTPAPYLENEESLLYNMHINLMLLYKFNI